MYWLFEAKKRFGLKILNFTVTSNHIHLLVYDAKVNIIPKSIQLIAGRMGREYHRNWVEEVLKNGSNQRDAQWTESIAVGDKEFVMETKAKLCAKAIGRRELENNEGYELKEPQSPYTRVFDSEKCS